MPAEKGKAASSAKGNGERASPGREAPARAARQHNYELKVMRRIVQKYNGTMTTEDQNVLGAVKIVLPPPKS